MICGIALMIQPSGKYMKLLAFLTFLSTPESGTVFDPTNVSLVVDIPLTEAALTLPSVGVIL